MAPCVLVFCRNKDRVERAVASICKAAGSSSSSRVRGYTADLSSLADVRRLAAAVQADHPRLHALVNNAGVYETQKK
jgi:NAD(P)-dependent dehydrogenase (short-subunit alcohol dehydrogenase family)